MPSLGGGEVVARVTSRMPSLGGGEVVGLHQGYLVRVGVRW